ncbi:MAG: endopeptidase La [Flavobacteriales bacterium]|nr:endopeptidase La [Flavobacteriales bacterium]
MNKDLFKFSHFDNEGEGNDFIALMGPEGDDEAEKKHLPKELPILPLRNTVLYPGVVIPITVGRDKSVKLIKDAYKKDKIIGVVSQKDANQDDPDLNDLYPIGTEAHIIRMLKMPDGNTTAILQGRRKIELKESLLTTPYLVCVVHQVVDEKPRKNREAKALIDSIREIAGKIIDLSPNIPSEANFALKNIENPNFLMNFISSNLNVSVAEKQNILITTNFFDKANLMLIHLNNELQHLELKNQIQSKAKTDIDRQQREYFLQQQMRTIQDELGHDSTEKEIEALRKRGNEKKWDAKIHKAFNKELDKLMRSNPSAPDYSITFNYCELLLELPWNEFTKDNIQLNKARKVLDNDHFGLEKVKDRILEYLAVLKLKGDFKSPILCLYGPPGVGKTSLGKSIAEAIGRKYARMSLGGMHDEAELRGHRKTYIGAMPGRIIQAIKKAGKSNPVFVLDEIDKLGRDFRGDPSSALLEILDPEQNTAFYDNYVEHEFDLSKVMFIATANTLDTIQPALLDRMEIIEINGYTIEEKIQIAKKHLVKKQILEHGLKNSDFKISDKVLEYLADSFTRESGVRTLEKRIASLARYRAKQIVGQEPFDARIDERFIDKVLGKYKVEKEIYQDNSFAGVVTGLAWTSVGGEILFVESKTTKGNGKLTLTGQLGDVMKESAITAMTFLKAHADYLGIDPLVFDQYDVHIHFPAGAVPKDGPSAGITILTSLASWFTQRKVRKNLAMTGEITLRGKVLPVGGIKEKVLAAKRAGINEIILCDVNKKDIQDIGEQYTGKLNFHYVTNMLQVLDIALTKEKVKNPVKFEVKIKDDKDK